MEAKNLNTQTAINQQQNTQINQQDMENKKETTADIVQKNLQDNQKNLKEIRQEIEAKGAKDTNLPKEEPEEDLSKLSKEEIYQRIEQLLKQEFNEVVKNQIENLKNAYYKKLNEEKEAKRQKFIEEGGKPAEFKYEPEEIDEKIKKLLEKYKAVKNEYIQKKEAEQLRNLEAKKKIIEEIEKLTTQQETLNKTFEEFKELQKRWREIGPVPPQEAKKIQEKYIFVVEKFYDWVKLNKEMRDLDLKKNLERKIELCEKAENLLLEDNIIKAYRELQKLHQEWKEIGPVPKDKREEIWERFKKASSIINKRYYEYHQQKRKEQEGNLKAKTLLCEEAEKIANGDYKTPKEWQEKTNEIIELQKIWRLIGYAPKKYNNAIYKRFRDACDKFFDKKRQFFEKYQEILEQNYQKKMDLVIQAESIKESTEWKKTTEICKELQEKWKQIGPVPKDKKDEIWNRFISACNHFFERKRQHFQKLKEQEAENLKLKQQIIEQIKQIDTSNREEGLKQLQALQKQWSQIGFVPIEHKDRINKEYDQAVKEKMSQLKLDTTTKTKFSIEEKIERILKSPNPKQRLYKEIEFVKNRISKLERDVLQLENNLAFFVKSKNAEAILANFEEKIKRQKERLEDFKNQLKILLKTYKDLEAKEKQQDDNKQQ